MDKALAYGARDSRFDPWQDRLEMNNFLFENFLRFFPLSPFYQYRKSWSIVHAVCVWFMTMTIVCSRRHGNKLTTNASRRDSETSTINRKINSEPKYRVGILLLFDIMIKSSGNRVMQPLREIHSLMILTIE